MTQPLADELGGRNPELGCRRRLTTGVGRRSASVLATVVAGLCLTAVAGVPAGAQAPGNASVPVPTVEGPIPPSSGISLLGSTLFTLKAVGYEQSEFFLSGTATSYTSAKPLTKSGKWAVKAATKAPYKTRVVVYRPIDPKRFDGTVVVEWFNETGGTDAAAAWLQSHVQMIRTGMVYVGVDAQSGGINGEPGSLASTAGAGGIKVTDPSRYGTLTAPDDSFSYSIFEQVGNAVHAHGTQILGGLKAKRYMALGESQSAFRLTTYIDALQPSSAGIYDAYFVYSRGGNAANLSQSPQATIPAPTPTYIRTDLHVPVFLFETETDVLQLGYLAARQPPTRYVREWEVAGTAHDDSYGLLYSRSDTGSGKADAEAFQSMLTPSKDPIPGIVDCGAPINAGSHTYELRAAIVAVNRWMATGTPPPQSLRLDVTRAHPTRYVTNSQGNVLGGIRTPQVQVPVAKLSGLGQPGSPVPGQPGNVSSLSSSTLCGIFGTTVPFGAAKLKALYPTHADFVKKWDAATATLVRQGYLLPADARTLDRVAARSSVGGS